MFTTSAALNDMRQTLEEPAGPAFMHTDLMATLKRTSRLVMDEQAQATNPHSRCSERFAVSRSATLMDSRDFFTPCQSLQRLDSLVDELACCSSYACMVPAPASEGRRSSLDSHDGGQSPHLRRIRTRAADANPSTNPNADAPPACHAPQSTPGAPGPGHVSRDDTAVVLSAQSVAGRGKASSSQPAAPEPANPLPAPLVDSPAATPRAFSGSIGMLTSLRKTVSDVVQQIKSVRRSSRRAQGEARLARATAVVVTAPLPAAADAPQTQPVAASPAPAACAYDGSSGAITMSTASAGGPRWRAQHYSSMAASCSSNSGNLILLDGEDSDLQCPSMWELSQGEWPLTAHPGATSAAPMPSAAAAAQHHHHPHAHARQSPPPAHQLQQPLQGPQHCATHRGSCDSKSMPLPSLAAAPALTTEERSRAGGAGFVAPPPFRGGLRAAGDSSFGSRAGPAGHGPDPDWQTLEHQLVLEQLWDLVEAGQCQGQAGSHRGALVVPGMPPMSLSCHPAVQHAAEPPSPPLFVTAAAASGIGCATLPATPTWRQASASVAAATAAEAAAQLAAPCSSKSLGSMGSALGRAPRVPPRTSVPPPVPAAPPRAAAASSSNVSSSACGRSLYSQRSMDAGSSAMLAAEACSPQQQQGFGARAGADDTATEGCGPEISMFWPLAMATSSTGPGSGSTCGGGAPAALKGQPFGAPFQVAVRAAAAAAVAGRQQQQQLWVRAMLSGSELSSAALQPPGASSEAVLTLPVLPCMQSASLFVASRCGAVGPSATLLSVPPAMAAELHCLLASCVERHLCKLFALADDDMVIDNSGVSRTGAAASGGAAVAAAASARLPKSLQGEIRQLREPSPASPPWRMSAPLWAACHTEWRGTMQPLLGDVCYLLLCVPTCFAHGLVEWDRAMYCQTLARLLAQLERYKLWATISCLLEYCTTQGVSLLYQGEALASGALSAERVRELLEGALHDEISIRAVNPSAAVSAPSAAMLSAWGTLEPALDMSGRSAAAYAQAAAIGGGGAGRSRRSSVTVHGYTATGAAAAAAAAHDASGIAATAATLQAWRRRSVDIGDAAAAATMDRGGMGPHGALLDSLQGDGSWRAGAAAASAAGLAAAGGGPAAALAGAAAGGRVLWSQASLGRALEKAMAHVAGEQGSAAGAAAAAPAPAGAVRPGGLGPVVENTAVVLMAFAGLLLQSLL